MTTLLLNDFSESRFEEIYGCLVTINDTSFTVNIQSVNRDPGSKDEMAIIFDYCHYAYAGELLSEVSSSFGYWVPDIYSEELLFTFVLEVQNIEPFIDCVYKISHTLNADSNEYLDFNDAAIRYQGLAFDEDVRVACPGLLEIANEFITNLFQ